MDALQFLESDPKQVSTDDFLGGEQISAIDFLEGKPKEPSKLAPAAIGAMGSLEKVGQAYPALETIGNILTMSYGLPTSGIAGLLSLPFGLETANRVIEEIQKILIYEPQTQKGRELTESTFYPIEKLESVATRVGDHITKKYGSKAGTAVHTAIMGSPMLIPLLRRARAARTRVRVTKEPPLGEAPPITPETAYVKEQFAERFLEEKPVKKAPVEKPGFEVPELERAKTYPKTPEPSITGEAQFKLQRDLAEIQAGAPVAAETVRAAAIFPEIAKKYGTSVEGLRAKLPKDVKLYGGLPLEGMGKLWTKNVGEPIWDTLIMKKVPKLLEKVPGGKAVNRAFLYEYRGDLPNTAKYLSSLEDMKKAQSIGREYGVDLGRRLQSVNEADQLKLGEYIRGEIEELPRGLKLLGDEAKNAMLDLGRQAVDAGLLKEETFFKHAGRYMPRLYTSKEYQGLLNQYSLKKPSRLDLSRFKRRKDIPKEIRQEMGEILTPGYPIAKGVMQLTHDIELARFFSGIAAEPRWAWVKKIAGEEPIPEGFKQLPSNKKLGALSEAYVHPEIFADLQETIRVMNTPEKVWRKSLGMWKFGKVVLSPKTHMRNLMSNSVLAHLGGLPMYEQPVYLTKAALAMKEKGQYWKMARDEGGARHTWTAGELSMLFDEVAGQMKGVKAGSMPEALGKVGQTWVASKKAMRRAADLYQAEEQWFKMAKFIHNIERNKMTPKAAWADAEKWLFNYQKITRFQEKYRTKWYGAPFCTFTFKAMPRITEAMIKTPWRFALPMAMIYALEKQAQKKIGDTPEEIKAKKALRPEWMQGEILGSPNFVRVPLVDEYGREHWLNLTYILPWGDIGEAGKFGPIPGGIMPFSQPFIKEPMQQIINYDSFWKKAIVPEKELAGMEGVERIKKEAKLRAGHAAQAILPTPVMDVTKAIDAIRKRPDYRGRFREPKTVAADVLFGVKMYPVDYVDEVMRRISKIDPQTGWLARKLYADIRRLAIQKQALEKKGIDTTSYDKRIQGKIDQLNGLAKETKETGRVFEEIRKE